MSQYIAILIEGDNENTLGGACSRDIWNITMKILNDLPIKHQNIHTFFHNMEKDRYIKKISQLGVTNISLNTLTNVQKCFDYVSSLSNTIIYFHYSGHGYQIIDKSGDEIDGCDEIFLNKTMTDDYIWHNFIMKLPSSSHIFATIDACHSGSGLDLPYLWENNRWVCSKHTNIIAKCHGFSLSACNDSQCASQDIGETTGFAGSLTAGLCDFGNIFNSIHEPYDLYNFLTTRLAKLNQTVELYAC